MIRGRSNFVMVAAESDCLNRFVNPSGTGPRGVHFLLHIEPLRGGTLFIWRERLTIGLLGNVIILIFVHTSRSSRLRLKAVQFGYM